MSVFATVLGGVVRVCLLNHVFGGVRGKVLPADKGLGEHTASLKEQLRKNILERRGCVGVSIRTVSQMEPIEELVLPPALDIREMAQKRGTLKAVPDEKPNVDVKTVTVHHRAVMHVDGSDTQAVSDAILHSRHHDVELEIVKGVTVDVIADDAVLPETPVDAEIIIFGPRAAEVEAAAQAEMPYAGLEFEVQNLESADLRFWDNFFARISAKSNTLDMLDDAHLFSLKDKYSKGYHPIREMGTEVYGIVHVTKNSMNALYLTDRETGAFRTVTQTKRFNEATEVGVLEAKAFLNGRY